MYIPKRVILAIMALFMFLVTQMVRSALYLVMVAIVEEKQYQDKWNKKTTGAILSAFYWCYWITEIPGGLLSAKFGGKKVLLYSVFFTGVICFIFPWAMHESVLLSLFLRALQGLLLGATWPAVHWLSARWIPPTERSKFMVCFHGAAIGACITNPLAGFLNVSVGWQWVFYVTGAVTTLWSIGWYFLIFDYPNVHPNISSKEKEHLFKSLSSVVSTKKKSISTPWKKIMCSGPFWAVLLASQALAWGAITLSIQTPFYFRVVHNLNYVEVGYMSGVPELFKFFSSIIFSTICDKCISAKICSLTTARKVAIGEYVPALLLYFIGTWCNDNPKLAFYLLLGTFAASGASSAGTFPNMVDLSPNHAGTILALIKTLIIIPGLVSPLLSTYIINRSADISSNWSFLFNITSAVYIFCSTFFLFFGSGEVQPWNNDVDQINLEECDKLPVEEIVIDRTLQKPVL